MPAPGSRACGPGSRPQVCHHREPRAQRQMSDAADAPDGAPAAGRVVRVLEICNKKGLHARASAKFVQTVERFDADVRVTRGHETVGGTSIMGLMMLAAAPGTSITVSATGRQAAEAVAALEALINSRFGEAD